MVSNNVIKLLPSLMLKSLASSIMEFLLMDY